MLDEKRRRREHGKTGNPSRKRGLPFSPRPRDEARLIEEFGQGSSENKSAPAAFRSSIAGAHYYNPYLKHKISALRPRKRSAKSSQR
jgi:hypothetical protein